MFTLSWPYPHATTVQDLTIHVARNELRPKDVNSRDLPHPELKDVIERCLSFDETQRFTFSQIEAKLAQILKQMQEIQDQKVEECTTIQVDTDNEHKNETVHIGERKNIDQSDRISGKTKRATKGQTKEKRQTEKLVKQSPAPENFENSPVAGASTSHPASMRISTFFGLPRHAAKWSGPLPLPSLHASISATRQRSSRSVADSFAGASSLSPPARRRSAPAECLVDGASRALIMEARRKTLMQRLFQLYRPHTTRHAAVGGSRGVCGTVLA